MDERQYYLMKIVEEANEVASAAMKCIQFGNDSRDPSNPDGPTNLGHLMFEINDLLGARQAAINRGFLGTSLNSHVQIDKKVEKIEKYKQICVTLGTVK